MRYDSGQFGSFDGKDNRFELMILAQKLGGNLPTELANEKRAKWLEKLIRNSVGVWPNVPLQVKDHKQCDPVSFYNLFVAICGALEVPIDTAAKLLDEEVSKQKYSGILFG